MHDFSNRDNISLNPNHDLGWVSNTFNDVETMFENTERKPVKSFLQKFIGRQPTDLSDFRSSGD